MAARLSIARENPAQRPVVTIVSAGHSAVVDLRRMRATRFQNVVVVRVEELWFLSRPPMSLEQLEFDFVGHDGYRVSRVTGMLLPGEMLKKGYLGTRTKNLVWDDPSVDGAFAVRGLAMIVAHAVQGSPNP